MMHAKHRVLIFNCLLLVLIEVFLNSFVSLSTETIIFLQSWARTLHIDGPCWALSELLGPQPRIVTMVVIMLFATSGEEASRWLLLRFFTTYTRWVLGMALQEPRPSWTSDRVDMLHCPVSYGLPSGHAMLLGGLAFSFCATRDSWRWTSAVLVWFVWMCIGRLYLGTHSLHDLLLGAAMGVNLALVVHDAKFVARVDAFFLDQGFWFVAILFCFGVSASFGFAQLLKGTENAQLIAQYAQRAKAHNCHVPTLYDPLEGVVAVCALCGLLLSMSVGRARLEPFLPKRLLALLVFLIPSVWKAESQALLVEIDFPYHSQMFLLGSCNALAVVLLFTTTETTKEEEEELEMVTGRTSPPQHARLVNYGAPSPLYNGQGAGMPHYGALPRHLQRV